MYHPEKDLKDIIRLRKYYSKNFKNGKSLECFQMWLCDLAEQAEKELYEAKEDNYDGNEYQEPVEPDCHRPDGSIIESDETDAPHYF